MEGTITRKDIITDDALRWGDEYAKNLSDAIAKNKEFVDSIILLNAENVKLRRSENQTEFIKQKNEVKLLAEQSIITLKEQQVAETNLEKVKQEALRTEKLALDIASKKQAAIRAGTKLTVEERLANEQNNRIAKEQAILSSKMTTAYTKLNLQRTIAKKNLLDLLSAENQNTEAIKKAEIEFGKLDVRVRKADHAVGDFHKTVGDYPKITNLASGLKNLAGAFGLVGGIGLFASLMKNAFDTIKQFDQGLADLSAITGASGKDLDYLKNQAIELGRGTKGGAVAVVEAYKLIASAKPELLENVSALNQVTEAVLTLAKASGMEMPEAATALTDAMNQFGADASQAGVYVDSLANGAKYGAAEIPQVTEALLKFGAVARTSNVSIQESTALVELLAENGLKGADAGTALRNVLLKISAPDALPKKAQEEFSKLGISLETLKDKSIPIQQKLELLKPLMKDNASIVKIFGLENATAAMNVLGHTERLKELTAKMSESGTALEQANLRTDTLTGSMDKLESSWSSFVLSLSEKGNSLGNLLKGITNELTSTVEGWRKIFTSNEKLKEEELNAIRKQGFDSIQKSYSDKNRFNDSQLEIIKQMNSKEILENAAKVNALNEQNKQLLINSKKLGIESSKAKSDYDKNVSSVKQLNKASNYIIGKNEGITSMIKSRQSVSSPTDTSSPGVDSKEQDRLAKEALDRAKRLSDSLYELQKQRLERSIKLNDDISKDDEQTDDVRIKALEVVQQKEIALAELNKKHSLDADKFVLDKDKMNANQKIFINNEASNKIVDINKKTSEEIEKIRMFDEEKYTKDLEAKVSKLNISMNSELQAENEKFKSLGDLESMAQKDREKAIEDHEKTIFEIKKKYAIDALKLQIKNIETELAANDVLPINEQLSAEKRQKIAETLSKAKLSLSEVEVSNSNDKSNKEVQTAKEQALQILEISSQLTGALSELAGSLFDAKIQNIDDEITKNNDYYEKQMEMAGNDEAQKDLLQKERDKKNEELEKKKRKEQHKQAVFNKAMSALNVGISTSMAIISALAQVPKFDFGISATAIATTLGIIGAAQLAAVLASPIPKYKMGRKGGKAETAWVGDGGVMEVITSGNGLNPRLTPNTPTLTHLNQGDIVHKSMADYQDYMKASILSGIKIDGQRMNDFQLIQSNEKYGKEMLEELKRNTRAIEKQKKGSVINMPKIDLNYHLWKKGNTNWN